MRNSIFLCLAFLFLFSCQETSNSAEQQQQAKSKQTVLPPTTEQSVPAFDIAMYTDSLSIPRSEVSVTMGNKKVKVGQAINCEAIPSAQYEQFKIPKKAIAACGGWWAGAGTYFYIIKKGEGNYFVLKGHMEEQQADDNYNYQPVMNLNANTGIVPL